MLFMTLRNIAKNDKSLNLLYIDYVFLFTLLADDPEALSSILPERTTTRSVGHAVHGCHDDN